MSASSSTMRTRIASGTRRRLSRAEADPRELLPAGLPAPCVPQSAEPPPECELAVPQILHDRVGEEQEHLAPALEREQPPGEPVGETEPEAPGTDKHGQHVHEDPIAQRREEECPCIFGVHEVDAKGELRDEQRDEEEVAGRLDQWSPVLEEPECRQGEPSDPAELPAKEHGPMVTERLAEPPVPAAALLPEGYERLRDLGPGHRAREKGDALAGGLVAHEPAQANDDFHVLADRAGDAADVLANQAVIHEQREVPSRADHRLLLEYGEDAREYQHRIRPIEPGPPRGERAEVLDHLEARQIVLRQADGDDAAVLHR